MLPLLEDSWSRVQAKMRERVGVATFDAWLQGLRPVLLERGTVYLEAESRLAADRVRALFRASIAEVLSEDFGTDLKVEIQAQQVDRFDALEVSPQRPVIDDGNRTAHLVLQSLIPAQSRLPYDGAPAGAKLVPANLYLFHGPSGVGKTFLLKWWREQMPTRALWFDLSELLKVFQRVHQDKRVPQLHQELTAELPLVIDEAHRIAGKPKLQSFLHQVLEARAVDGAPTILASRWHPKDVRDLDPSLQSAWMAGFVAGIERPGPLGRLRYLRALEGSPSRNGRAPQIEALAQKTVGGYPELRAAWAQSRGATLPPRYLELIDPRTVFQRVRERVAERLDVSAADLCGKSQSRALSRARKVLAKLCQLQGLKGSEIGNFLGRTRAAVSYMVLSLEKEMQKAPELRQLIEELQ
ncbi:MAG: DnaA N-terminal domain-containing protein [Planctomycetota bacterium]|nr:DnaA N-terminal domain-containing protein [Planctomycetota bacterium]